MRPVDTSPRWLHWWAILTVAVTLPLAILGTHVTTHGWGLVDERGLRSPWYFFAHFVEQDLGWKVEHGHRLMGWIAGVCVIVLAVGLWLKDSRRAVRWLGTAALLAVAIQGTLGIFRIELHARLGNYLAMVHGFFAQIVITLLVCIAVLTSRSWFAARAGEGAWTGLRSWSFFTVGIILAQLFVGGFVRHLDHPLAGRLHLLLAFAVLACAVWLARLAFDQDVARRAAIMLLALVALQVFLGIESWLIKFANQYASARMLEPLALHPEWFRSLHYLTGTMILATATGIAMRSQQALGWLGPPQRSARTLEEAV